MGIKEIKKVIGTTETDVYGEKIYCKLLALSEMFGPLLEHLNEEGTLRADRLDRITVGINSIFDDILIEMDQLFFEGEYTDDKKREAGALAAAAEV